MKKFRLIAFDVGDTLYQVSNPNLMNECWKNEMGLLRKNGLKFRNEQYYVAAEYAWRESQKEKYKNDSLAVPKIVQKKLSNKINEKLAKEMSELFIKTANKYSVKNNFILGAKKVLRELSKKYYLAVISDTETDWFRKWVFDNNYKNFVIFSLSYEVGGKKASGKPYKYFVKEIKKLNIKPKECLMVGDLSVDMDAKKYGIKTCLYNPLCENKKTKYKPDYTIKKITDLLDLLK